MRCLNDIMMIQMYTMTYNEYTLMGFIKHLKAEKCLINPGTSQSPESCLQHGFLITLRLCFMVSPAE